MKQLLRLILWMSPVWKKLSSVRLHLILLQKKLYSNNALQLKILIMYYDVACICMHIDIIPIGVCGHTINCQKLEFMCV